MEDVNEGGEKGRKWHSRNVCSAVLRYISYAMFSCITMQILEVLQDFHRLFGSRNRRTTGILHTICHVYRSVWPTREAKPRFGAALKRSAHDCGAQMAEWLTRRSLTNAARVRFLAGDLILVS